jgi:hypothetical protein
MYLLLHLSIFHPSIIIIPGRAAIIPGPVGRNVGRENYPRPGRPKRGPCHRAGVKIKPGPITEPRRPKSEHVAWKSRRARAAWTSGVKIGPGPVWIISLRRRPGVKIEPGPVCT